jgi:hypothetical protein
LPDRDYVAEMSALLDRLVDGPGDLSPPVAAATLVEALRRDDPDLLSGWLDVCATAILTDAILHRNGSRRNRDNYERRRAQFGDAASSGALGLWRTRWLIADGSQRSLPQMTADDCRWLAGYYRARGDGLYMRSRFFDQLAAAVADANAATVGDVVDEARLDELWSAAVV